MPANLNPPRYQNLSSPGRSASSVPLWRIPGAKASRLAGAHYHRRAFVINAFVTGYVTGGTPSYAIRIPVLAGLVAINTGLYFASFTALTARTIGPRGLLPGAVAGTVGFTALITVGTGLVTHQLKNARPRTGRSGRSSASSPSYSCWPRSACTRPS